MREVISAGGLIYREAESPIARPKILVVRHMRDGTISIPKGRPKEREPLRSTAVREVGEETGLKVRAIGYLGMITYPAHEYENGVPVEDVSKTLVLFSMEVVGTLDTPPEPHLTPMWMDEVEAAASMHHVEVGQFIIGHSLAA